MGLVLCESQAKLSRMKKRDRPIDRFPYPSLGISYIAEQSYCEKRVALWLQNPGRRVSVPKMIENKPEAEHQEQLATRGIELHKAMARDAVQISATELEQVLKAGHSPIVIESTLFGEFGNIGLIGKPDAVCFCGRKPSCIVDYKFARLGPQKLTRFGGNIRSEAERVVCLEPDRKNWARRDFKIDRKVTATLRIFKYDHEKAKKELIFFSDFWLGKREAKPTTKAEKCAVCLYNKQNLCSSAVAPFNEARRYGSD
jgi:hypothetical protein